MLACGLQLQRPMHPYIDVRFQHRARDASLASSVHRWVARFEGMRIEVARAEVEIDAAKRQTCVLLTLTLANGKSSIAVTSHVDPYVAVSNAFRAARRDLLVAAPSAAFEH